MCNKVLLDIYVRSMLYAYCSVVACTLNSRLSSGYLGVITVGDFFSRSTMIRWVCNSRDPVLCARVLLLQVSGTLQQSSRNRFLFACLRRCFSLNLSNRNKTKPTVSSKKHASRPPNLLMCLLSGPLANGPLPLVCLVIPFVQRSVRPRFGDSLLCSSSVHHSQV